MAYKGFRRKGDKYRHTGDPKPRGYRREHGKKNPYTLYFLLAVVVVVVFLIMYATM